jgi:hypothetical protein
MSVQADFRLSQLLSPTADSICRAKRDCSAVVRGNAAATPFSHFSGKDSAAVVPAIS